MNSKHKKSHFFHKKGLFSDLRSFNDLENRISKLPIEERGDAFEVFAEAYFNTQKIHQAHEVWPDSEVPQSLRNQLGLPSTDKGIDGIFQSRDGQYHAYQVKYRSYRSNLAWEELSTFMGLSDKSDQRVLFTNSNDISSVMNARTDFYSIKGNDLDKLEHADFKAIENWFSSGLVSREKKIPLPHQSEAITDILEEFKANDRTTAVMACGSGKTLVALWAAEKKDAHTIIVLLSSLALVRQTLHDWAKENSWDDFNYLCVCSDATVIKGMDETVLRQHDLDFPVTTQREVVQQFLDNKNSSRKIIFSTYQSCRIVAQAMPKSFAFDLAIFDEAHKTASREGANYAFALQDNNLPIKKRLFLTATPRHYNVNKRDKEGEQRLVYSMDDEITYGRIAHQLSFRGAVERDLICDYKVIVSVVTSEEVNRELLKRGKVIVDGDVIKAQRMANIIAAQNAIEKYGTKKIFSFHNSVNAAKSFTSNKNEGIGAYLKGFASLHVNGEMSTSVRDNLLKEFKESERAIISNARCLTEGVNVPAVNMVAFVSPKKSQVDIVQAAGRAMRKSPGKEFGYILIPLFIQLAEDEKLEEALEKTKFQTVWDVLQAMQEQDESLVEIIAQMREERGKALGFNDNRLREKVEVLGPQICMNELRKLINTKIIDQLGITWDERFGELGRFKEEYGHCNVPRYYQANQKLGAWVGTQRYTYGKGLLISERYKKLTSLELNWCLKHSWEERFSELVNFKKEYGHCDVPYNYINKNLASWVANQRVSHKKEKLALEKFKVLNSLGFKWDSLKLSWEERFSELVNFKKKNGHCNVPYSLPVGAWAGRQRKLYKQGMLASERCQKLINIAFDWDPIDSEWDNRFAELIDFKKRNGHCNVPQKEAASKKIANWVGVQRKMKKCGTLSSDRYEKLNDLGFVWSFGDRKRSMWEERFSELVTFKKEHGHCNVTSTYQVNKKLGFWVPGQRKIYKQGKLSSERYKKLNDLGFIWDRNNSS